MSMLRNVLTYMGLGPDEDYDDGYLYESADNEIDLTEDEQTVDASGVDDPYGNGSSPFGGSNELEEVDSTASQDDDPHAQRSRPDWLEPPAPTSADATSFAASSGRRRISIEEDEPAEPDEQRGRHDKRSSSRVRPLRAVPPSDADLDLDDTTDGVSVRPVEEEPDAEEHDQLDEVRIVKPKAIAPRSFSDAKILADEFKAEVPVIMNLQDVDRELARRLIDFASGICYVLDGSMEKMASQVFLLIPDSVEVSGEDRRRIEERGYAR